jgi:hypothetical protein
MTEPSLQQASGMQMVAAVGAGASSGAAPAPAPLQHSSAPVVVTQGPGGSFEAMTSFLTEQQDKFVLLLREERETMERQRQEVEAKLEKQRHESAQQMVDKVEKMREEMSPAEAISEQRLAALQARLQALHVAKLLSDDEAYALEDIVADYLELKTSIAGVVTLDAIVANESASKLLKLIGLSEGMAADSAFARQARRKYL